MAFLSLAAQGAGIATSLMAAQSGAAGAVTTGENQAYAARYEGAVKANEALIASENSARAAEARAEADVFNAKVSDQLAESETDRAGAEATDFRRAQGARLATSRARQAASGLALEGSPLMVDESIFQEIEFGAQRLVYAGQVASTRLTNQGSLLRRSASLEKETAGSLRDAGRKSAQWAVEGGEIGARGATSAGNIRADAYRLAGFGDAFRGVAGIGTTLTGRGVNWGV